MIVTQAYKKNLSFKRHMEKINTNTHAVLETARKTVTVTKSIMGVRNIGDIMMETNSTWHHVHLEASLASKIHYIYTENSVKLL